MRVINETAKYGDSKRSEDTLKKSLQSNSPQNII